MPTSAILKNMVELPGGTFRMGSKDFYPEERPVREVSVASAALSVRAMVDPRRLCDRRDDLAWRQLPVAPNRTTDRERA